jgi:hypothetical protein
MGTFLQLEIYKEVILGDFFATQNLQGSDLSYKTPLHCKYNTQVR